jgi:hypothetical protein
MLDSSVDTMMRGLARMDGFLLACLIDPLTGTLLDSVVHQDGANTYAATAGASDVMRVLSLMAGGLALDSGVQDVVVTLTDQLYLLRYLPTGGTEQILLLVVLERSHANFAMALREVRQLDLRPARS